MKRVKTHILEAGFCRHPEAMTIKGGSLCTTKFPALVGLINHPQEGLILFDTGYDQAFFTATQSFPERFYRWATPVTCTDDQSAVKQLAQLGFQPEDVRAIIISHFHGDHVAGLHRFPGARLFCAREGISDLNSRSRFGQVRRGFLSDLLPTDIQNRAVFFEDSPQVNLPSEFSPFEKAADILGDGSLLAVPLPGHCPGHWGLLQRLESDQHLFFVGDAAWSLRAIVENRPPPRLTTSLLGDTGAYSSTLRQLSMLASNNNELITLPSHCRNSMETSGLLINVKP